LGYGRAAKIIDMLEQNGIVGPGNGAKPREVLVKPAGGNSMNASTNDFPDDHA
jgi:S-DNA-T family DNA segregation ATPase FtsK/SpoIIIE